MDNIFENAKFGDKFRSRDGKLNIYIRCFNGKEGYHYLLRSDHVSPLPFNDDGSVRFFNKCLDIVGKWVEPNDKNVHTKQHKSNPLEKMDVPKFARDMKSRSYGTIYSRADISAILYMALDCIQDNILEGKKFFVGNLGGYSIYLQSNGERREKDYTGKDVSHNDMTWDCSLEISRLLPHAELKIVPIQSKES